MFPICCQQILSLSSFPTPFLSLCLPLWAYLLPHKIEKSIELHLYNIWLNSFCLPSVPSPCTTCRACAAVCVSFCCAPGGRAWAWRGWGGLDCGWVLWAGPLTVCGHCVCPSVHLFVCLLVCLYVFLSICLPWPALYICGFHGVSSSLSVKAVPQFRCRIPAGIAMKIH